MRIFKFGGASVRDASAVRNLAEIVAEYLDKPLVVVVSAMGKSTNLLEKITMATFNGRPYESDLDQFIQTHRDVMVELAEDVPMSLDNLEISLRKKLQNPDSDREVFYNEVIPYGEMFSTVIVHHYLSRLFACSFLDARNYIKTKDFLMEANIDWELTEYFIGRDLPDYLREGPVITQGFIGSDLSGKNTTLGREGSDFTGAIFAYCLNAESLTVWKDVPGLLNADPKVFSFAECFDELSFQEVSELTYYGAKVIHPKTLKPLAQKNIPLYVKSFLQPSGKGTKIHQTEEPSGKACFVFKENQLLVTLRVRDNSFIDERKLGKIFQALDHVNIKINLMHNSALTFTFCMDQDLDKLDKVNQYLQGDFFLRYNEGLQLTTIKNYTRDSFELLPPMGEFIFEQKTRSNYQVVFRPLAITPG